MDERLRGAVPLARFFLAGRVRPGDRVLDATCGHGRDTVFLARLVGAAGKVWALDIQEEAVGATRLLLQEHDLLDRTELLLADHCEISGIISGPLKAAVFNLGYLPGGDRSYVTRPDGTVSALDQAAALLVSGGVITVCIYTGHEGGVEEEKAVCSWAEALDPGCFSVWQSRQLNRSSMAPYLIFVEKM